MEEPSATRHSDRGAFSAVLPERVAQSVCVCVIRRIIRAFLIEEQKIVIRALKAQQKAK